MYKILSILMRSPLLKFKLLGLTALLASPISLASTSEHPVISGVNSVSYFNDDIPDKHFVGNGFLLEHESKLYAVTAKHVLFELKTPQMNSVSISKHIKAWKIVPKSKPSEYILLGALLNEDTEEKLTMEILKSDWLVFEVIENQSSLVPLKLRSSRLHKNEVLSAVGCTYNLADLCHQMTFNGQFSFENETNLFMEMTEKDLMSFRGLSGSPVVDENMQVVGIVSNVLPHPNTQKPTFAPATSNYLLEVLRSH